MKKTSSLTTTYLTLQNCEEFGFYFVCSTCHQQVSAMLELGKDGIELSQLEHGSSPPNWWHSKLSVVQTGKGRLLISCGACRSGSTVATVSKNPAGTYFLAENLDRRSGERRANFDRWQPGMPTRRRFDRRKFEGDEQGRLLRERLEFFQ
jgi:hypothetical protein